MENLKNLNPSKSSIFSINAQYYLQTEYVAYNDYKDIFIYQMAGIQITVFCRNSQPPPNETVVRASAKV